MSERKCGSCQSCCTILPVRELDKPALTRCKHQRFSKGCAIYAQRPPPCRLWSCMWLLDEKLVGRPDHVHYVVDIMSDVIAGREDDTGKIVHMPAVQVWVDPKYPHAHRDPNLRAYLLTQKAEGFAIVRYGSCDGLVLIPPHRSHTGDWLEKQSVYAEDLPGETHDKAIGDPGEQRARGLQADDPA